MEEFDLKEFAQMFDAALASDNPAVKKALRNFMMVTALVHAQEDGDERIMGPLETLVKKVGDLERMVYDMNTKQMTEKSYRDYYKDWVVNTPTTWKYSPNTSTSSSTTWMGKTVTDDLNYISSELSELMKEIKFK